MAPQDQKQKLSQALSVAVSKSLQLVFPPTCFGCGDALNFLSNDPGNQRVPFSKRRSQELWCTTCHSELCGDLIDRCYTCAATVHPSNPYGNHCPLCNDLNVRFERAISIGDYRGKLQELVIQLKREKSDALAVQLGRLIAEQMDKFDVPADRQDSIDYLAPIPTHWTRRLKRGFHASAVIAEGVSQRTGIPTKTNLLRCNKSTEKQGTLSNTARFDNMRGAFKVSKTIDLENKSVMIVDDVMTSGATINAAASALKQAGAAKIWVGIAARGARVS